MENIVKKYSELFLLGKGLIEAAILFKLFINIDLRIYTYSTSFVFVASTLLLYKKDIFSNEKIVKVFALSSLPVLVLFVFSTIIIKNALFIPAIYLLGFLFVEILFKLKLKYFHVIIVVSIICLTSIAYIYIIIPKVAYNKNLTYIPIHTKQHSLKPVNFLNNEKAEFHGKVVIIDFWATWCKPCIEQFKEIEALHLQYKNNEQVELFALNTSFGGDSLIKVNNFVNKLKPNFNVLYDSAGLFSKSLSINVLPTTIVIDQFGIVRYKQEGVSSKGNLQKEISLILKEIDSENLKK